MIAVVALLSTSCGGTTVEQISGPDAVRCAISLSPSSAAVPYTGSQLSVTVSAARECEWETSTQGASWAQITPPSGQGEGTVTVTAAANTLQTERTTTVFVSDAAFGITQAAAPPPPPSCSYTLAPASRVLDDDPTTASVAIQTGPTCPWTAESSVPWITLTASRSGTGPATLTYSVTRNVSRQSRTGGISIATAVHVVVQTGR